MQILVRIGTVGLALALLAGLLGASTVSTKTDHTAYPQYPALNPIEKMKPNGEYAVALYKGGSWQEIAVLAFDEYFRERKINLEPHLDGQTAVNIRLVQRGGAAAHIDSVLVGGLPPTDLKGIEVETGLGKLSERDFDVIDAFGKTIELVFPTEIRHKALKVTARVEGERITEVPFQFPPENLYKKLDSQATFYRYVLNSVRTASPETTAPFFMEFSPPGTGHPFGFTYGWVWNDADTIYVYIDFTVDNTMDGTKDYAKVHVNTESGIREFKVSTAETSWGYSNFVYTDKVHYQHKVYHFQIPMSELNVSQDYVQLAFAAYGTAAPCARVSSNNAPGSLLVYPLIDNINSSTIIEIANTHLANDVWLDCEMITHPPGVGNEHEFSKQDFRIHLTAKEVFWWNTGRVHADKNLPGFANRKGFLFCWAVDGQSSRLEINFNNLKGDAITFANGMAFQYNAIPQQAIAVQGNRVLELDGLEYTAGTSRILFEGFAEGFSGINGILAVANLDIDFINSIQPDFGIDYGCWNENEQGYSTQTDFFQFEAYDFGGDLDLTLADIATPKFHCEAASTHPLWAVTYQWTNGLAWGTNVFQDPTSCAPTAVVLPPVVATN